MDWLRGEKSYDRSRLLKAARRAAKRGAHSKAVSLYAQLNQAEPDNIDVLRRISVHRIRAGSPEEALRDCRAAAEKLSDRGFVAQAIGVYRDFTQHHPRHPDAWRALSELELERQRSPDAVGVLIEGSQHFRSRKRRKDALALLRQARALDRTHFEAGYQLADLTWRAGGGPRLARRLLESLVPHARTRRDRRRLRARLFRLSPTPAAAWRWLRAVVGE